MSLSTTNEKFIVLFVTASPNSMLTQLQQRLKSSSSITFKVKIVPKSSKNQVTGELGSDTIKIKIAAIAAKGKANKELIVFLAELFGVPRQNITILSGLSSARKIIKIVKTPALGLG